jgi:hypothetical protein
VLKSLLRNTCGYWVSAIGLAAVIFASGISSSLAQSSYTVGPLLNIIEVNGSQARATLDVTNAGKEAVRLRIYVEDFAYIRDRGFTPFSAHPYSAIPYLQFTPRELVVPPQTTRNVRVNILIPSTAPDGEYRAVVFTEELRSQNTIRSQSAGSAIIITRVGSIFFANKGNGKADISATGAVWNNGIKQPQIILSNQGLASSNPGVQWKIEKDGRELDGGVIPALTVQNRSERIASLNIKKDTEFAPGEYTVFGQLLLRNGTTKPFSFTFKIPN